MLAVFSRSVSLGRVEQNYLGGCCQRFRTLRFPMPTCLQDPVERSRGLQQKWARLLQQGSSAKGPIASSMPPREPDDDNDDDEEQDEAEEDREPAVVREPERDE